MKMKRLLVLPFLILGFLAGCGEGEQTSQENQSNTTKKEITSSDQTEREKVKKEETNNNKINSTHVAEQSPTYKQEKPSSKEGTTPADNAHGSATEQPKSNSVEKEQSKSDHSSSESSLQGEGKTVPSEEEAPLWEDSAAIAKHAEEEQERIRKAEEKSERDRAEDGLFIKVTPVMVEEEKAAADLIPKLPTETQKKVAEEKKENPSGFSRTLWKCSQVRYALDNGMQEVDDSGFCGLAK
ncbi:hypothetical protein [Priestia megaterium]|uniref:hypothetical protein n=1 Tax=Priestia megaterium TaxID=1404 RepID=UPI000BF3CFBA|nr:hypothetical protein [Priestia megaterium]MCM3152208.1 hypothetical protein [Priestia megaterium]PEU68748.1 hypothetical protein CN397_20330 [Priestia megaterium]PFQ87415.1 hypothetical protein COK11_01800 [Priestia megaterium]PFW52864.1 hypothetical protein COL17_01815 [Priestia megaterium]UYT85892.1 hypothetical protein OHU75_25225 [Priestia megaterium]